MENWKNLNAVLILERKEFSKKESDAQKMVEFCLTNNKEEIKNLLKNGSAINCYADMATPLVATIKADDFELCKYLLVAGASITFHPEGLKDTALWESLKNKKHNFLKLFVDKKCILVRDIETRLTPLIFATQQSDEESVEILLSHYAIKVNEKDGNGNTALHYNVAIENQTQEDINIGKLLLAAGADSNLPNLDGLTPQDLAADPSAKSLLLHNKITEELITEDFPEPEQELDNDLATSVTKNNKMKI